MGSDGVPGKYLHSTLETVSRRWATWNSDPTCRSSWDPSSRRSTRTPALCVCPAALVARPGSCPPGCCKPWYETHTRASPECRLYSRAPNPLKPVAILQYQPHLQTREILQPTTWRRVVFYLWIIRKCPSLTHRSRWPSLRLDACQGESSYRYPLPRISGAQEQLNLFPMAQLAQPNCPAAAEWKTI